MFGGTEYPCNKNTVDVFFQDSFKKESNPVHCICIPQFPEQGEVQSALGLGCHRVRRQLEMKGFLTHNLYHKSQVTPKSLHSASRNAAASRGSQRPFQSDFAPALPSVDIWCCGWSPPHGALPGSVLQRRAECHFNTTFCEIKERGK